MLLERSLQAQEEQNQALADFRRETQEKEERRAQVDAAVAAEVASLRSELLSANAAVADLTKRVAAAAKPPHSVGTAFWWCISHLRLSWRRHSRSKHNSTVTLTVSSLRPTVTLIAFTTSGCRPCRVISKTILPSRRSESGVDQIMHCMHAEPWGSQITGRYMHDVWQNTKTMTLGQRSNPFWSIVIDF